jgi:predicted nucleic acid-binding Zn ribbon protein
MNDAPLTHHPETGKPITRIILGSYGIVKSSGAVATPSSNCCGPSGCC